MRDIKYLIVHCSDSSFGDASVINDWHLQNGWSGIGYHFVILNGYRSKYDKDDSNGLIEEGRDLEKSGAHCIGYNDNSIGICLIGEKTFTYEQLVSLVGLLYEYMDKYNIPVANILGHYETEKANGKTCPNFNMNKIREILSKREENIDLQNEYYGRDFDFRYTLEGEL